ncbi:MAG: hypothetical protein K6G22_09940 [Lachnospiraceae bacterium]|nr:hypothetical protein [Lachnospiraceae bacterium]
MKKTLLIVVASIIIFMTGGMECSLRTAYAADNLVDINVSSSGGRRHSHHSEDAEKTEKEIEVELSRANIEAQEEELKQMPAVQVDPVSVVPNVQMLSAKPETAEKKPKTKLAKGSEEPKTAGSDLPIVPIALMIFFIDMLIVVVESAGDFDDYIRKEHIEKLVEKYKKGGKLTRIVVRIRISLCIFYSRWKAKSDRNINNGHEKCSAA